MTKRFSVQATVSAQNTFTDTLQLDAGDRFTVSLSGSFVAKVTLQRLLDGTNWRDVESYIDEVEIDRLAVEGQTIRIGVKTGDYTSGSAVCRIGRG